MLSSNQKYFCWLLLCTCRQCNLLPGITLVQLQNFIKLDYLTLTHSPSRGEFTCGPSLLPCLTHLGSQPKHRFVPDCPVLGDTVFSSVSQRKLSLTKVLLRKQPLQESTDAPGKQFQMLMSLFSHRLLNLGLRILQYLHIYMMMPTCIFLKNCVHFFF